MLVDVWFMQSFRNWSVLLIMQVKVLMIGLLFGSLFGCSTPAVSKEGPSGSLWFGTKNLSDICVVVHQKDGTAFQSAGFGTTNHEGFFYLVKTGGHEPLILEPGEYAFTLESLGPQIVFPTAYLKPETSPLKVTWSSEMTILDLKAPEELLAKLPN